MKTITEQQKEIWETTVPKDLQYFRVYDLYAFKPMFICMVSSGVSDKRLPLFKYQNDFYIYRDDLKSLGSSEDAGFFTIANQSITVVYRYHILEPTEEEKQKALSLLGQFEKQEENNEEILNQTYNIFKK